LADNTRLNLHNLEIYLYKKKIKIVSDHSQRLGEAQFPAAKIKDDEFFGKVGIYRDNVLVSVPVLEGAKICRDKDNILDVFSN
jgi:thiol:disulfide interchange protein